MSERTHSPAAVTNNSRPSRKYLHLIGGTACALLLAGFVLQYLRARPGQAQTGTSADEPAGQVRTSQVGTPEYLGRVNTHAISYDEVARECVARYGAEILDSIINRTIIQQECERRGVVVTEAEVRQEVVDIAKKFNLPLDTWYQMLQAERNINSDQYHKDIIWPMLALKKLAGQNITVTEVDMRKAFERDYGPRVKARVIFIDGNQRRANEVWEQCQREPENFDQLAMKYSADPNSRPLGGTVPPIRKHGGHAAIEEAAFKTPDGQISSIINVGENRYVILKSEGLTSPVVPDIQDVWDELRKTLVEEKTQEAVAAVFEGIKNHAEVINYLTNRSTVGARPGNLNPGNIRQVSGEQAARPATAAGR